MTNETPQSKPFSFTAENLAQAQKIIAKYPAGKQASALIPLLDLAQRQSGNWLPREAMEYVADMLCVPHVRAYEVASFYTMFNLKPVGAHHVQVCTTTPCWLRGSVDIVQTCRNKLGIGLNQVTPDGKFSLTEVECCGACVNAPVVQINDDTYEDLTPEAMEKILDALAKGEQPPVGSQTKRQGSCACGGATTLKDKAKPNA